MGCQNKREQTIKVQQQCANPHCFFCAMEEPNPSLRRPRLAICFREMPLLDDPTLVLVLSTLWSLAMTRPDDPEFPSLGVLKCMSSLVRKGVSDPQWLLKGQNIYIPYYAAHIIGSYTMNRPDFAEKAVESGAVAPLVELLRGEPMSWVEQRVAVRALGHLTSYDRTFEAVAAQEDDVVRLAMSTASAPHDAIKSHEKMKYHMDLMTRGVGGQGMENQKAEEWAAQLQCWSLYLLNCFASRERGLRLICRRGFLTQLAGMWGCVASRSSPAGIGLLRLLCYNKIGRQSVAEYKQVVRRLCNLSRSSDNWQYMGIDCLVLLLKDPDTRYQVIDAAAPVLADLVELRRLGDRSNVGETITRVLLLDRFFKKPELKKNKSSVMEKALEEVWELKVERRKKESGFSKEEAEERRALAGALKREGNKMLWSGKVEAAAAKYSEGLEVCPLQMRKERTALYSSRAQCHLVLGDADSGVRDATRALCACSSANSHSKSLWRRSQAYDMKEMAKESLLDCIMFLNSYYRCGSNSNSSNNRRSNRAESKGAIPHYAARMIGKQMEAVRLSSIARLKMSDGDQGDESGDDGGDEDCVNDDNNKRMIMENKGFKMGMCSIRTACN